ncbi:MAG: hypothetical protein HWE20_02140 [Gammaproteobacteria bacterium]|nr:hypothetical protein [Gammaproteobacteria bacterium]
MAYINGNSIGTSAQQGTELDSAASIRSDNVSAADTNAPNMAELGSILAEINSLLEAIRPMLEQLEVSEAEPTSNESSMASCETTDTGSNDDSNSATTDTNSEPTSTDTADTGDTSEPTDTTDTGDTSEPTDTADTSDSTDTEDTTPITADDNGGGVEIDELSEEGKSSDAEDLMSTFEITGPNAAKTTQALEESLEDSTVLRGAVEEYRDENGANEKVTINTDGSGMGGVASQGKVQIGAELEGDLLKAILNHELGHALLGLPDGAPNTEGSNQYFDSAVRKEATPDLDMKDADSDGIIEY